MNSTTEIKVGTLTVVVAAASYPAAMQYSAHDSGCATGEWFMEHGQDALVVYDDLSKHAWAYRQVSLLMRNRSGNFSVERLMDFLTALGHDVEVRVRQRGERSGGIQYPLRAR